MSCYEWERGEITIPTSQWAGFKKALRDSYNAELQKDLVTVAKAIERVKVDNKGKRGVNWKEVLRTELYAQDTVAGYYRTSYNTTKARYELAVLEVYQIADKCVTQTKDDATGKIKYALKSLKQKDFPAANTKTIVFDADDGSIHLTDKTHCVTWSVQENNHACERARDSFMGKVLFNLLSKIQWVRGSGGCITGNDEYNRENQDAGGGANQLKDTFGPLGEKQHEFHYGMRSSRSTRSVRR